MLKKVLFLGLLGFCAMGFVSSTQAFQDADGFDYPIGSAYRPTGEWYNGNSYANQTFGDMCFHSGDDWNKEPAPNGDVGQPVKAIGHGQVVKVQKTIEYADGVAIKHNYKGGVYFSIYWHIHANVLEGQEIKRGDIIGTIAEKVSGVTAPHFHLEMRDQFDDTTGFSYSNDGRHKINALGKYCDYAGYYHAQTDMNLDHLIDPTRFIDEHRVATWHPNGTLIRASGDATVWYLQNGLRRGITSAEALVKMGFSEDEIILVSPQERDCYDAGETITTSTDPASLWPSVWNGYPERTLVRFTGVTTPERVYVTSEGFLHWLNMSWNDFISLGYRGDKIHTLDASYVRGEIFRADYLVSRFKQCENKNVSLSLGGIGGGFGDMPNDYDTGGNPPPTPDQTLAGNNTLFAARFYDGESLQGFDSAGVKIWSVRGTGEIAFDGVDILAIGCDDVYKTLVHIDPASGAIKSSFRLAFDGDIGNCGTRSQMSLWSDRLYILSPSGNFLYAIRKSDGALLWKRASGYGWESDKYFDAGFPPTVGADGTVYLARQNGSLAAINADGTIRWQKDFGGKHFPPKVWSDGTIFYALYDTSYGYVYAFSPDGSQKWQAVKETGSILKAVSNDGVYVRNGSVLTSLDPQTGSQKWQKDVGNWDSLLVGANGAVYVPRDGYALALSPTTGEELGRYVSPEFNHVSTSLAQMSDGSIAAVTGTSPYKVSFLAAVAVPPLAESQSVSINQNTPRTIEMIGWGANWEPVTFSTAILPSHGMLGEIQPNNRYSAKVIYTPLPEFSGSDAFTFRTNDGVSLSSPAVVSLTVAVVVSANPPIAEAQSVSATANTPVEITLIGWGPNWEPVTFAIASAPSHGTLGAIAANNRYSVKVVYTPAPGFFGSDTFTFRTNDGVGYSAAATVSVTVR